MRASIRQLMALRWIAISGQAIAIAVAWNLGALLPLEPMVSVVAALVALNLVTLARLRGPREPGNAELAAHLGADFAAFTALLYFAGGASNPFSALFVLHGLLMALLLPGLAAAAGASAVVVSYVALGYAFVPMRTASGEGVDPVLLSVGNAMAIALTVGITAWFVARIVATLREHDRQLALAAQQALRDEAVLRVGDLAAGAAHELATPLTTLSVVANEIAARARTGSLKADAATLVAQVAICRETVTKLLAAAGQAGASGGGRERLDWFVESIASRCRVMRPEAHIVCEWDAAPTAAEIFAEQGLRQALLALVNNAVDASPGDVRIGVVRRGNELRISVVDRGHGVADDAIDKLGRAVFTTKPRGQGAGLGLVLARRAVERLGGTLGWTKRSGGGLCAEVVLPWHALSLAKAAP